MHSPPFALSLSKRSWCTQGFDRLSPNGVGSDKLSPNGAGA
jgi:hypothetical protein